MKALILATATSLILLSAPLILGQTTLVLYYPPDKSLLKSQSVHLVLRRGEGETIPQILLNGQLVTPLTTNQASNSPILHYLLPLTWGLNQVELASFGQAGEKIDLFCYSEIAGIPNPPPFFKRQPFHLPEQEQPCQECHVIEATKGDLQPPAPEGSTCYSCHRGITSQRNVHGPASVWACLACHPLRPQSGPTRFATPEPVNTLCYSCHQEQKQEFETSQYQHGPTAAGRCTICHNPHSSNNIFFLKRPIWDLCTSCHAEKGTERHAIAWGPTGQTHPTRGKPDISRPGRELVCSSCHNPHASKAPYLWRFNVRRRFELCQTCHKK